jgi:small subunit ribosomal protein S6
MAEQSTLYDLVLLLSSDAPSEQRERVLSMVQSTIQGAGGSIERDDDWGRRPMAYEIRHQPDAEYHLLQLHAPGSLIEELSHTLRITDGVLRFRIIKVRRGTPEAKSTPPPVVAAVASSAVAEGSGPPAAAPDAPADGEAEEQAPEAEYSEAE